MLVEIGQAGFLLAFVRDRFAFADLTGPFLLRFIDGFLQQRLIDQIDF